MDFFFPVFFPIGNLIFFSAVQKEKKSFHFQMLSLINWLFFFSEKGILQEQM